MSGAWTAAFAAAAASHFDAVAERNGLPQRFADLAPFEQYQALEFVRPIVIAAAPHLAAETLGQAADAFRKAFTAGSTSTLSAEAVVELLRARALLMSEPKP